MSCRYLIVEAVLAETVEAGLKEQFKKFISGLGILTALSGAPEAKAGISEVNQFIKTVDQTLEAEGLPIKYHISTRPIGPSHTQIGDLGWNDFQLELGPYQIRGHASKTGSKPDLKLDIYKDRNASKENLSKYLSAAQEVYKLLGQKIPQLLKETSK